MSFTDDKFNRKDPQTLRVNFFCTSIFSVSITVYSTAAIILIVVSVIVIIVTFFGCCGAIKENKCMLGTYFTIILVSTLTTISNTKTIVDQ